MQTIIQQLTKSDNLLIASHIHPDGDAIGSEIAMGLALAKLGKKVTIYNEDEIPKPYQFLPSADQIVHHLDTLEGFDAIVVLDCGDVHRIGDISQQVEAIPVMINIDHHLTNTGYGHMHLIDSSACATAEIVYRIVKNLNIPVSKAMAFAIYTAIMTDTGSFRFSNTNKEAFSICEEMVGLGVDPNYVANHVFVTYSLSRIKLLNMVLESIEVSENGKLSVMALTQKMLTKTGTKPEDIGRLINYARNIEDVKVAALIFESKNGDTPGEKRYHISLRSDGTVDVAAIAAAYGGGGHMSAAGFNLTATLADVKSKILNLSKLF